MLPPPSLLLANIPAEPGYLLNTRVEVERFTVSLKWDPIRDNIQTLLHRCKYDESSVLPYGSLLLIALFILSVFERFSGIALVVITHG